MVCDETLVLEELELGSAAERAAAAVALEHEPARALPAAVVVDSSSSDAIRAERASLTRSLVEDGAGDVTYRHGLCDAFL